MMGEWWTVLKSMNGISVHVNDLITPTTKFRETHTVLYGVVFVIWSPRCKTQNRNIQ
jgi:hypothetical protein